jgi:hydrogenase maturation protease
MSTAPRILIGGIGNIFLGDDAFGVEVVKRLARRPMPPGVHVKDFGIRGIDLTYELLEDYDRVILVDAMQRGEKPGTVYVMEPNLKTPECSPILEALDTQLVESLQTHDMSPIRVLAAARAMGAQLRNILIVGCEPESFGSEEEPRMVLSQAVAVAVDEAVAVIDALLAEGNPCAGERRAIQEEATRA